MARHNHMEAKSAGGMKYNRIGVLFSYLNYQTEKCVEIKRSFGHFW